MTYEQLLTDLGHGKVGPLYLLHGEEPYFIDKITEFFEDKLLSEAEKAFNLVVLYGKETEYGQVVDECRQLSMFAERRVVILKEAQDMKSLPKLEVYAEKPVQSTILVVCHKYKKIDRRTKLAKLAEENGIVFESKTLFDNQVAPWIKGRINALGFKTENGVAELLAENLGSDLSRISNEIEKLSLNAKKDKLISIKDIREYIGVSKDFDVFELCKALVQKDFRKSSQILNYFAENATANPPPAIIATIYGFMNKVMIVKYHGRSGADLAKLAEISPFFLDQYKQAANHFTIPHLTSIFAAIKKADMHSKGVGARKPESSSIYKDILVAFMNSEK